MSSSLASPIRSLSLLSTTKIKPCNNELKISLECKTKQPVYMKQSNIMQNVRPKFTTDSHQHYRYFTIYASNYSYYTHLSYTNRNNTENIPYSFNHCNCKQLGIIHELQLIVWMSTYNLHIVIVLKQYKSPFIHTTVDNRTLCNMQHRIHFASFILILHVKLPLASSTPHKIWKKHWQRIQYTAYKWQKQLH
jgi:hypothetical protein